MMSTRAVLGVLVLLSAMGCAKQEEQETPRPETERDRQLAEYAREAEALASGRVATEENRAEDTKARKDAEARREEPGTARAASVAPMQAPGTVPAPATQLRESSPEWKKMLMDRYRSLMSEPGINEVSLKGNGLYIGFSSPQPRHEYERVARATAVDLYQFREKHLGVSRSTGTVIVCEGRAWEENAVVSVKASSSRVEEPVWHR
jgi:hypothetical protein